MPILRIDKIISSAGLASRSEVKRLIQEGRVTVDGISVLSASDKYDSDRDIRVDGKPVAYRSYVYIMMNKPAGYLSVTEDRNAPTVLELLSAEYTKRGLFPAGRLDKDSEGLLLLTDDGDFCHRIISPKSGIEKEYFIRVSQSFPPEAIERFALGITLGDGTHCLPARLELSADSLSARVFISEGKYHQVKRMAAAVGTQVIYLKRLAIASLRLPEEMAAGEYSELTEEELSNLKDFCNK